MSILGRHTTGLAPYGSSGPILGRGNYVFMTDLEFPLNLAGPKRHTFQDPTTTLACRVDDQGVRLIVQVLDGDNLPVNIRAATGLLIKVQFPDGTGKEYTGVLLTNGTDGRVYYATVPNDLNQAGLFEIQAQITMAGNIQTTARGKFWVSDLIPDPI